MVVRDLKNILNYCFLENIENNKHIFFTITPNTLNEMDGEWML